MKAVRISKRAAEQIDGGSLWIFANEFQTKMSELVPGEWLNFEAAGKFVGYGYVNPHSLIAGRVCSRGNVDSRKDLLERKIREAAKKRKRWGCADSSFRTVFSESDGLPGLIIDAYDLGGERNTLVASLTTAGMSAAKEDLAAVLGQWEEFGAIVLRADSSILNLEQIKPWHEVVRGDEDQLRGAFLLEDDVWFAADFIDGQKTGFFLDQKDNRRRLKKCVQNRKALGKGTRVLDLCCYSGGWGLTALKAGADHVTFVDQAADALQLVKKGMAKNGFSENRARFAQGDVFDFLKNENERFDMVVADPPAFVKSKKNLSQAARAYQKLNTQAIHSLTPEGVLFTSSCSFHFSEGEFEKILVASLQESRRTGRVFHRGTQSEDHPWVINRPESRYLKCFGIECLTES